MDPDTSASDQREQRMLAVAKLKRAASLPRMKDGRRPPMRPEAVSEGEKGNTDDEQKDEIDSPPPEPHPQEPAPTEPDVDPAEDATITPARSKRRSRSRTRSRGSKDLKLKARAALSPTPSPLVPSDSSQDEAASPLPPSLASPIPSNLATLQRSRLLRSPTPTATPDFSPYYPGTRPPTPNLPSLEDLQRGLFRSNSVGSTSVARTMAMHKLTGGTETYDPSPSPTPPPPPLPGKLGRNNTVSGGERNAARQFMLSRLGGRIAKEPEGEPASGGEEYTAPSPTPKRKRRRSRRGSASANTGVSDSEFLSTSPNTPVVPPTPLPAPSEGLPDIRPQTASPNRAASPRSPSEEELPPLPSSAVSARESPVDQEQFEPAEPERPEPTRRRSVVVEEEDEERVPPQSRSPSSLSGTSPQVQLNYDYGTQAPQLFSDFFMENVRASPSVRSSPPIRSSPPVRSSPAPTAHSSRHPTPEYPPRSSPFTIPLQEKQSREEEEEEQEEEVLYPADSYHSRPQYEDDFERQISWVATPVPEIRMPIDDEERDEDDVVDDEEDEEEYERQPSPRSSAEISPQEAYDDTSPRNSFESKGVMIEPETSPEIIPSQVPPSPSSLTALSQSTSIVRTASDDSTSPQMYPARLSVASRTQDRSPLNAEFEWEDGKRNWDGASTSTWDKIKTTFRSGSAAGRRSRTNSIARERRDNTDSSVSRESGASLTSAKTDKGEAATTPLSQPAPVMMQSASASASAVSLSPLFPTQSSADLLKYQNVAKLFPFPGMKKLEEQRNRAKGITPSASTPDIATLFNGYETDPAQTSASYSNTPSQTPEMGRDRKLPHQASETGLKNKYGMPTSPTNSVTPASPSIDYFNVTPLSPTQSQSSGSKLPMTLPGVKQWMKMFSQNSSQNSATNASTSDAGRPSPSASKKPSLSDLILRKENGLVRDWEDVEIAPLSASESVFGKAFEQPREMSPSPHTAPASQSTFPDTERTPKARRTSYLHFDPPSNLPSPPDALSATPDPSSSLSDYPAASTSESSSTTSSHYSFGGGNGNGNNSGSQGSFVLERLEENLARGSRSPMWASAIDDPPRKLLLSSPVLQVVNANTVKDRFLFLFSDILVIAKPVVQDQDIIDSYKPTPMDRKFVVKSVVLLNQLRFNAERTDIQPKTSNYSTAPRNPLIRTFVHQFSKDTDHAISSLLSKSGTPDDPLILGQLLFKTLDLDRARLGDYLARRTSKVVLKAYVDSFRFVGVRVDKALRAFLLSINVPAKVVYNVTALDYLLDAFASRWYEANARIVAYDKDLAVRLVRALVQLNDFLHGGIAQEAGPTGYPQRGITGRDFIDAFRRYDPRYLVSDELLEDAFDSIRDERLCQARPSTGGSNGGPASNGPPDIPIMIKRPLPTRLTYKLQSEPIILRIQQADPHLTIQLFGQDLVFDPPFLTFGRSSEASFRVTGTSLGQKTMIICRSGPNALKYAALPLSNSLVVERAFMRNTFEMAFLNHCGTKRRYMFSVDDPLIRHQWAVSLRRQIDIASSIASSSSLSQTSPGPSKFHRAAEIVAFKALQQTLMGTDIPTGASPAAVDSALRRLNSNGSPPRSSNGNGGFRFPAEWPSPENPTKDSRFNTAHVRSKSRSKVYHRGAGRNELDLHDQEFQKEERFDHDLPSRHEDLEMQCQQNSSIPLVLAFLQVGYPEHGQH
ncbi:hypothetical protein B0H16DRAFT_1496118 [Mycena metata]|uniref:SEC7 domain-containing protein n=1 Tax=Mycena metata TaxID=1033252 RepID=A0AAD7KDT4_9AGAR|nr:hypothetical protein B0H16DRAFT_1496118 [Mycena metata]